MADHEDGRSDGGQPQQHGVRHNGVGGEAARAGSAARGGGSGGGLGVRVGDGGGRPPLPVPSSWWDPTYWLPMWMTAWCPPIALGLLAWGAYRGRGVGEKLSFIAAGSFFSPHLAFFALAVWLWWVVPMGIRHAKDFIWRRIVALFRCPPCGDGVDVEQGQPEEDVAPPPAVIFFLAG